MADLLQAQKNQNPPPNPDQNYHCQDPQTESLTQKIEGFIKLRAPTFDYTDDPIEAEDWLREIEKKLDLTTCTDAECVALAVHQLTGSASAWWDSYWEFRNLKQGAMKVQEYVNLFFKMMRYAPDDTRTNEKKQYWFLEGLHPRI
ncbi:hypothetical protein U9M48_023502 [Paspalum notatum var. saurae]|uniref:Retrotransposon gag domain-containing protein n=1 Tax=Paspalum notatum var. saurae TaxID=547442 RepID=A0AAQ3TQQ6_PASNO